MSQWYFVVNNQRKGPVDEAALQNALATGKLPPVTMVWTEGMQKWEPANKLPQFSGGAPAFTPAATPSYLDTPYDMDSSFGEGSAFMQRPAIVGSGGGGGGGGGGSGASDSYAGFWKRFAALIVDSIVLMILGAVMGAVVGAIYGVSQATSTGSAPTPEDIARMTIIIWVLTLFMQWLYYALFESSGGQATPGKKALGIIVTDLDGNRISFWRAVGRYPAKLFISGSLTLCIGFMMAGFTDKKQALHDMVAGTLVVNK